MTRSQRCIICSAVNTGSAPLVQHSTLSACKLLYLICYILVCTCQFLLLLPLIYRIMILLNTALAFLKAICGKYITCLSPCDMKDITNTMCWGSRSATNYLVQILFVNKWPFKILDNWCNSELDLFLSVITSISVNVIQPVWGYPAKTPKMSFCK